MTKKTCLAGKSHCWHQTGTYRWANKTTYALEQHWMCCWCELKKEVDVFRHPVRPHGVHWYGHRRNDDEGKTLRPVAEVRGAYEADRQRREDLRKTLLPGRGKAHAG